MKKMIRTFTSGHFDTNKTDIIRGRELSMINHMQFEIERDKRIYCDYCRRCDCENCEVNKIYERINKLIKECRIE